MLSLFILAAKDHVGCVICKVGQVILHLAKFLLHGSQRDFGFLPLLLAVVEDGRHVLPEVGCRHLDSNNGGEAAVESDVNDLEQAFAEFGSWFCQKNSSRLAKVVTLGSYSTCGYNFNH